MPLFQQIIFIQDWFHKYKDTLSGLKHVFSTESSLKMLENAFYSTLKAAFIVKINFCLDLFAHEGI